jgi:DNA-binding beta-propeller fold protein YncE
MPPRPARGVVSGGKLYVTLDSTDFVAYGPGRVAVIDPATDTVSATIDLPRLKNCVAIAAVPGEPGLLTVSCAGPYDADQLEFSGIARIDTGVSPPLVHVLPASAFGRPISGAELAVAALPLAFAITAGDFSGSPPDQLWAFDLGGGAPRKLLDGGATPFTLAGLLFDPASQRVFVTDANAKSPRIHVFDVKDPAAAVALTSFDSDPEKGLLPRYTGLY